MKEGDMELLNEIARFEDSNKMDELRMGWSWRHVRICPSIPRNLKLGETVVYLAHKKAVEVRQPLPLQQAMCILEDPENHQPRLLDCEKKPEKVMGIFCVFVPQRIEKLVWESEATSEALDELRKKDITSVIVPDGDEDHA